MNRRLAPTLLIALAMAGRTAAQSPDPTPVPVPTPVPIPPAPTPPKPTRIVLPDTILPYRLVRIEVTGDFDTALFFIEPAELADIEDGADGKSAIMTGPPGHYTVQVATFRGVQKPGKARAVFVIPEPIPTPTPGPDPDIDPDTGKPRPKPPKPPKPGPPAPPVDPAVTGVLNASLVVDLDTLTPELAALRQGINVRAAFPTDFVYRTYATASPDLQRLNLAPLVAQVGTPALILQDANGKVVSAERAPATEAEMIAKIRAVKGGK